MTVIKKHTLLKRQKKRQQSRFNCHTLEKYRSRLPLCHARQRSHSTIHVKRKIRVAEELMYDDDVEDLSHPDKKIPITEKNAPSWTKLSFTLYSSVKTQERPSRLSNIKHKKLSTRLRKHVRRNFWTMKVRRTVQDSKPSHLLYTSESVLDPPEKERRTCNIEPFEGNSHGFTRVTLDVAIDSSSLKHSSSCLPFQGDTRTNCGTSCNQEEKSVRRVVSLNDMFSTNDIDNQMVGDRGVEIEAGYWSAMKQVCTHEGTNLSIMNNCSTSVADLNDFDSFYLVPHLDDIINCSFYWGVMDFSEASSLLFDKPDGTFLLRDSKQDEFLFSISYRRNGHSRADRIQQKNHKFRFHSEPHVFRADTVCGLIAHYRDQCPSQKLKLITPLHRTFPFSLKILTRAAICNRLTYDGITQLPLPMLLKDYLKKYHYTLRQ